MDIATRSLLASGGSGWSHLGAVTVSATIDSWGGKSKGGTLTVAYSQPNSTTITTILDDRTTSIQLQEASGFISVERPAIVAAMPLSTVLAANNYFFYPLLLQQALQSESYSVETVNSPAGRDAGLYHLRIALHKSEKEDPGDLFGVYSTHDLYIDKITLLIVKSVTGAFEMGTGSTTPSRLVLLEGYAQHGDLLIPTDVTEYRGASPLLHCHLATFE
jgi:hypothetical protein